jgi:hypothetical protein
MLMAHPGGSLAALTQRGLSRIAHSEPAVAMLAIRAFSGKVDTGFPQKMRPNKESRGLSDSTQSESPLGIDLLGMTAPGNLGPGAMSDLSAQSAPKRTLTNRDRPIAIYQYAP